MNKIFDYLGNVIIPESELDGLDDLLENRLLIWHDEFVGPSIDTAKWQNVAGAGVANNNMRYAKDINLVASVSNGLKYKAIKDNPNVQNGIAYSTPFIYTSGLFEFQYGRIEAKIKFPNVTPHHTTFWTLGANSARLYTGEYTPWQDIGVKFPSCGEIDIAEFDNGTVGGRMHWASNGFDGTTYASGGDVQSLTSTPTDWHIYSAEWTDTKIDFYVDGVLKGTWNTSNAVVNGWNPFNHPHYIILNCIVALSGTPSWDVAQTEVAWVRVYAPENVTEYIMETAVTIDATKALSIGESKWLEPIFTPLVPSDMTLQWKSHNDSIVTCYCGMLTGVSAGTTYVQCTTKHGHEALCKVTVT